MIGVDSRRPPLVLIDVEFVFVCNKTSNLVEKPSKTAKIAIENNRLFLKFLCLSSMFTARHNELDKQLELTCEPEL